MPYPVHAVTRPADLSGQANGNLHASLLVAPGFPGRAAGRLHRQCARSWAALAAAVAQRFAETLTVTSSADAYRSYAVQESTFRARYTTTYLPGRPYKTWNGQRWYQKPGTAMAATPGTSNHGWGLAVDACYWRNGTVVGITANTACFNWLLANAHLYGFSWEVQSEPWHLRLFTGDNTPKAVAEFEKPPAPPAPPPTIPGGHPMFLATWKKKWTYLVQLNLDGTAVKREVTGETQYLHLAGAGVLSVLPNDDGTWDTWIQNVPEVG